MALGKRVQQRLDELQMDQTTLANLTGVTQSAISALITRDSRSSRQLVALAAGLRCEPQWLETGKGPKEISSSPKSSIGKLMRGDESEPPSVTSANSASWKGGSSGMDATSLADLIQKLSPRNRDKLFKEFFQKLTVDERIRLARLALAEIPEGLQRAE